MWFFDDEILIQFYYLLIVNLLYANALVLIWTKLRYVEGYQIIYQEVTTYELRLGEPERTQEGTLDTADGDDSWFWYK